jgi:hypothetical protein
MRPNIVRGTRMAGQILFEQAPDSLGSSRAIGKRFSPSVESSGLVRQKSDQDWNSPHFRPATASFFSDIGY